MADYPNTVPTTIEHIGQRQPGQRRRVKMGIFNKASTPQPMPSTITRGDIRSAIEKASVKERNGLIEERVLPAVEYLQRKLPAEETVLMLLTCDFGNFRMGCFALTDSRLILTAKTKHDTIEATALRFGDIRDLNYGKMEAGVSKYALSLHFGDGEQITCTVARDREYGREFLDSVKEELNTAGPYGI